MTRRRRKAVLILFAVCATLVSGTILVASDLEVRIVSPDGDSVVFGDLEVVVEVLSEEPIESVWLRVDGLSAGQLTSPPFTFLVSVGEENVAHHFEAQALSSSGIRAIATVTTPEIRVDEVVDLALQQAYVTVTDNQGKRVLALEADQFRLFDDGRQQTIVTFAVGEIPFSALLLIDGSQSMEGRQMAAARAGARAFLAGMNELDEAKVMVFATRLLAASEFSGRESALSSMLEEVQPGGGTAINDFVFLGLRLLERRQGRRVLVLLTDGWDVHSVLRMGQVAGVARQSQAQIYWLQLEERRRGPRSLVDSWRDPSTNRREQRILERVIGESGGRILSVGGPNEIEGAFQEVLAELREQYALGYYPDQRFDDGRWRQLKVEVEGKYTVKTREGYLDLP